MILGTVLGCALRRAKVASSSTHFLITRTTVGVAS